MNFNELVDLGRSPRSTLIRWLQARYLLADPLHCARCNCPMEITERNFSHVNGFLWYVLRSLPFAQFLLERYVKQMLSYSSHCVSMAKSCLVKILASSINSTIALVAIGCHSCFRWKAHKRAVRSFHLNLVEMFRATISIGLASSRGYVRYQSKR